MNFQQYYSYRENTPVQPQAQAQPQPQAQPQGQQPNNRVSLMLNIINQIQGTQLQGEEGYNQIGRSNGFLERASENGAWSRLQKTQVGQQIWNNIPMEQRKQILTDLVMNTSR